MILNRRLSRLFASLAMLAVTVWAVGCAEETADTPAGNGTIESPDADPGTDAGGDIDDPAAPAGTDTDPGFGDPGLEGGSTTGAGIDVPDPLDQPEENE